MNLKAINDRMVNQINAFYGTVYENGLMLINLDCPAMNVILFIESSISGLVDVLPSEYSCEKEKLRRCSMEVIMIMCISNESRNPVISQLFSKLTADGFSSEQRAVSCAVEYCGWLKERGQESLIPSAIKAVNRFVTHPYMINEMNSLSSRMSNVESVDQKPTDP